MCLLTEHCCLSHVLCTGSCWVPPAGGQCISTHLWMRLILAVPITWETSRKILWPKGESLHWEIWVDQQSHYSSHSDGHLHVWQIFLDYTDHADWPPLTKKGAWSDPQFPWSCSCDKSSWCGSTLTAKFEIQSGVPISRIVPCVVR